MSEQVVMASFAEECVEMALPGADLDIDSILDARFGFRSAYEHIDHPAKEVVLRTLASLQVDPNFESQRNIGDGLQTVHDLVYLGTRYFGEAAYKLARARAEYSEKERRDQLAYRERYELGTVDTRPIDEDQLVIDVASLETAEIIEHMVTAQMWDAFNVAHQGYGRLPFWVSDVQGRNQLPNILATGLILANRLAGFPTDQYYRAATSFGGEDNMTTQAYNELASGIDVANHFIIGDQPASYQVSLSEAGYGLFRANAKSARYILLANNVFWPNPARRGLGEYLPPQPGYVPPEFSDDDAVHMCNSASDIASLIDRSQFFPTLTPESLVRIAKNIETLNNGNLLRNNGFDPEFDDIAAAFSLDKVKDPSSYVLELLAAGHADLTWDFYRAYKKEHLPALDIFKSHIDPESYEYTQAIIEGNLTREHELLGITEAGDAGIQQMKEVISGIEKFILSGNKTDDEIMFEMNGIAESKVYERLWRVAVRLNVAAFGETGTEELLRVLNNAIALMKLGQEEARKLDKDVYRDSGLVEVQERISTRDGMNPDAERIIEQLDDSIKFSWSVEESLGNLGLLSDRVDGLAYDFENALAELASLIADTTEERTLTALEKQSQALQIALGSDAWSSLQQDGGFLSSYDQLSGIKMARGMLRERALRDAKFAMPNQVIPAYRNLLESNSVEGELVAMLDAIDHVVVQEYLLKLRPNDKAYTRYVSKVLFNTSAISGALDSLLNRSKMIEDETAVPKRKMRFVPTRDIGLELSGQIGDACWAGTHQSIAGQMPNMTAVLLADSGAQGEGLVGSGLFLEATALEGDELLIVRGLNPIQNYISRVDAHHFLEVFMDYAKQTADRAGRSLAITYDHRGGASTNRPALFNAMTAFVIGSQLSKVDVPSEQVLFNGYDLKDSVYLVG